MPVKRRRGKLRLELPAEAEEWLRGAGGGAWLYLVSVEERVELWRENEEVLVAEHAAEFPGSRPERWWEYSAPEPRRRLGGVGTLCHECLAQALRLRCGVPADWVTRELAALLLLAVPALDPADPPLFEAEAAYLDRLGLLLPGERARLGAADFEPESVQDILALEPAAR